MSITFQIQWPRYALIADLAKRLQGIMPQFGKTALQKLVYFLQEIYGVDCGYDFSLYTYGPFDSQLLSDLNLVEHWRGVSVQSVGPALDGYHIIPAVEAGSLREKASDFLDKPETQEALDDLVQVYGRMTARELELRATTVYVERDLRRKGQSPKKDQVCRLVGQIKMKFSSQEIERTVDELNERGHIQLAA